MAAGDIAFTQAGFDKRIQQGTDVAIALDGISRALDGTGANVKSAILGSWGTAQTTALMEINSAVARMREVVDARNQFLGVYASETWANDSEVAQVTTKEGVATSGPITQGLAGAGTGR
ncbi:MAG: hypothetical protein ACFCVF_16755 [Kineosporiaceae bacterium]